MDSVKNNGRIYTPEYIVNNILKLIGYYSEIIIEKHIIDNSCGDGAFLIEVVERYCRIFIEKYSDKRNLKQHLEKYIHGIEIDEEEHQKCIANLNMVVLKYEISDVNWDIICDDALKVNDYNGKMDFVVGNPPYVRVHNLLDSYLEVKKYKFCNAGMTDLFIVFYEIGFNMLSKNGKLGYITPSSFLRSKAGAELRRYIFEKRTLKKIVDLEHFQAFNATTYSVITIFDNDERLHQIEFYKYNGKEKKPCDKIILRYDNINIDGKIFLSSQDDIGFLKNISNCYDNRTNKTILVKNGFATLSDKIFIGNFTFDNCVINIIKASTSKWAKCIFPYKTDGSPYTENEIKTEKQIYEYLLENKQKLLLRDNENSDNWFLFGRTQAIKDVFVDKISINTTIKDFNSLKINSVPAGCGVYSGLYIISQFGFDEIKEAIYSSDFIRYIKLLKNYKSGGYYSFSSSELERYLYFKLMEVEYEQLQLSISNW